MKLDFVTIFPEYFQPLELSLIGKASQKSLIEVSVHDLRDEATNVHRQVDDTPYGGAFSPPHDTVQVLPLQKPFLRYAF